MKVYNGIMQGLEDALAYNKVNSEVKTSILEIPPIPEFNAGDIKAIRNGLGMTQVLFAEFMGVSPKTVEAWEAGRNIPNGSARRILSMLKTASQP